jgi:hypothetical protein
MSKAGLAASARAVVLRRWARADASYPRLSRGVLFLLGTAAMWVVFGGGWLGLLVEAALIVLAVAYWGRISQLWDNLSDPAAASGAQPGMGLDESSERLYAEAPKRL